MKNLKTQPCCKDCKFSFRMWLDKEDGEDWYYWCNVDESAPEDISIKNYDKWENKHKIQPENVCDLFSK